MKRLFFVLTAVMCLMAGTATAGEQSSDISIFKKEADADLLFYRFAEPLEAGRDSIEVEVLYNGKRYIEERIELVGNTGFTPSSNGTVVELLAPHAQQLRHLHRLALRTKSLEVSIRVNGNQIERLAFQDLVKASSALELTMIAPQALRSELTFSQFISGPAASKPLDLGKAGGDCRETCDWYYEDCIAGRCNYNPCQYCEDEYEQCLVDLCGACEPSTVVTTETIQLPTVYDSPECVYRPNPMPWQTLTAVYRKKIETQKIITTTTTTHTDCSQTVSQTVTYNQGWCLELYSDEACMPASSYFPGQFC